MSKKNIPRLVLFLSLAACLVNPRHPARAAHENTVNDWKHLETYDISFLIRADLNNDGREEKVTIYRQWDGEGWYSDDQWYIICIFDEAGNLLYKKDISYFQEVGSFAVKDRDGDGLKEVIVSLEKARCWDAKTQIYGWKEDSYRFMGEFKSIDDRG